MIPREQIEAIIVRAAEAPSGDNAQPWRFEVHGDAIDIYNIPGKDYSPYNYEERGSLFAHGALIENATIAASSHGYGVSVALFPGGDRDHVARLALQENFAEKDPLASYIEERTTNRKPYKKIALKADDKEEILALVQKFGFGELRMIEDAKDIAHLARVLSLSDRLIFEDKKIHDAIFTSIRWTEEQERERAGLYIKTLELPPPARALFKALKRWKVLTVLNKISISKFIASQSAKNYAASSAFAMVTIPDDKDESFVMAGRLFERLWLTATRRGVAVQPVTALPYLAERVIAGAAETMSLTHQKEVKHAYEHIREAFGRPAGAIAMIFRIGYGPAPTARSKKAKPTIHFMD